MKFSITRGEKADYATQEYATAEERDAGAAEYAASDGEPVHCMEEDDEGQSWLVNVAYPPGQEPEPVNQRTRWSASAIIVGDTVTVWGYPAGEFGTGTSGNHTGTVVQIEQVDLPFTTLPGLRILFLDGRQVDVVEGAVATLPEI